MKTKNILPGLDFGPITDDSIKLSMYGVAIKTKDGNYVSYDATNGDIIDTADLTFSAGNFIYKMPSSLKDIKVGDIILHNSNPVFVTSIADRKISCVDIAAGEEKVVIPAKNMFGFDFVTKIACLGTTSQDSPFSTPDKDNPFGSMFGTPSQGINPMMLMMMLGDRDEVSTPSN